MSDLKPSQDPQESTSAPASTPDSPPAPAAAEPPESTFTVKFKGAEYPVSVPTYGQVLKIDDLKDRLAGSGGYAKLAERGGTGSISAALLSLVVALAAHYQVLIPTLNDPLVRNPMQSNPMAAATKKSVKDFLKFLAWYNSVLRYANTLDAEDKEGTDLE